MRVFLAGASGAVGRPLVPMLVEAGHEVVGTTRSKEKAEAIRSAGAEPAIVDVRDMDALRAAVSDARPEVVVNQLTSLPDSFNPRDQGYLDETNVLRGEVAPALADAAASAGARRLVSQSVAFLYHPAGGPVKSEEDPILPAGEDSAFEKGAGALAKLERSTLETPGLDGLVLRYGFFYGPGTYYAPDGSTARDVVRRRFPVVGEGSGVFSYVHLDDAAAATVAAVERGEPGIYNICDDEPARLAEWLPVYAEALGAKPPRRVPKWLARIVAGSGTVQMATELRGASNAKAKRELGWTPRYPSWRQGFREALG